MRWMKRWVGGVCIRFFHSGLVVEVVVVGVVVVVMVDILDSEGMELELDRFVVDQLTFVVEVLLDHIVLYLEILPLLVIHVLIFDWLYLLQLNWLIHLIDWMSSSLFLMLLVVVVVLVVVGYDVW